MKPATGADLRAAVERECTKILSEMFGDVCDCSAVPGQKTDVILKTSVDKTIK